MFNLTQGGRGCAFARSQGWSARLPDLLVIHTRHPLPLQSSGCCSSSLWSTSCWLCTWTTCWRMRTVSEPHSGCGTGDWCCTVLHAGSNENCRQANSSGGTKWPPSVSQPHPTSSCFCAHLCTAGVRKGTPWYFLTPSYWTGRGSGRAGSKNVVRTARWGLGWRGRRARAGHLQCWTQRAVPVRHLLSGCAWHPGSVAPSVGLQPTDPPTLLYPLLQGHALAQPAAAAPGCPGRGGGA